MRIRSSSSPVSGLRLIDAFADAVFQSRVAGQRRFVIEDAGFVSWVGMLAGLHDEAVHAAGMPDAVLVGGEVGHGDIAVGVFLREDHPEVAPFVEAKEGVAWIHEARA